MGLGKTIQVLALLLARASARPSLLVAPASLLANWLAEIEKFAPDLKVAIVHPSAMSAGADQRVHPATRGRRSIWRSPATVRCCASRRCRRSSGAIAILDEAQAIKNPNAKQTRAAKALKATARIALTGTPVENHLGDLWSIFDFINPGLLGSAKQFSRYAKMLADRETNPYGPLRELVRPYILRRMKTDKAIITDLPGQDRGEGVLRPQPQAGGAL